MTPALVIHDGFAKADSHPLLSHRLPRGLGQEAAAGEGAVLVHHTPAIDETCEHDWASEVGSDNGMDGYCTKCGLSFTRYIYCRMP